MSRAMLLVLVVVAVATAPKLSNALVWDDLPLIVQSDFIHRPANLGRIFRVDTMYAADDGAFQSTAGLDTYRPLTIATFFADAALSGRAPLAYHVDNLVAHLLVVWLVFLVARRLLAPERRRFAPWAAALFGLHPLLGEAHIWINGRSDVWCTVFVLLGVLAYLRTGLAWACAAFVCFLSAALCKETAIAVLPALLLLPGRGLARRVPLVLAPAAYLALRAAALGSLHVAGGEAHLLAALRNLGVLWLDGLSSLLVPIRVMPRYLNEEYTALPAAVLWGALAAAVALAVVMALFRRRWPLGTFALAWYALGVAPAALVSCMAWYGFGRFLYLPFTMLAIAGVDAALALGARLRPRARRLVAIGGAAYLALFAVRLALSTASWNGSDAFYQAIIAESPHASHGVGGLGRLETERGRYAEALPLLEKAVALAPTDHRYLNNLGTTYLRAGARDRAAEIGALGVARFPREAKFEYLIALATDDATGVGPRLGHIVHGLELAPTHAGLRRLLATLVTAGPKRDEYRRALDAELAARPGLRALLSGYDGDR
jgi:tetratricopeptide (TPR) repeat protein